MTRAWVVLLLACVALVLACGGSTPPPRPATEVAVGSEAWNTVRLPEWSVELPAEALAHVRVLWRDGERRAELSLTGAAIGSSVERMADDEARTMQSLEPGVEIVRRRIRVAGVVAIGLRQGDKDVLVAMRNPWRALRLVVIGGDADEWLGSGAGELAGLSLQPQLPLESATFESEAWILTISRTATSGEAVAERNGWTLRVREKTGRPENLDRIRTSLSQ